MEKPEQINELPKSLELAKKLEESEDLDYIKQHLGELLDAIEEDIGVELIDDVETIYEAMRKENCLVRVEQLSRILETVKLNTKLDIGHKEESHYANAVIPEDDGFRLAYAEGQAPGPFRAMVSFGKTIIGFKTDHLEVYEVDFKDTNEDLRDVNKRKYVCRHVRGEIEKEDIRYMIMRMPRKLLDEKHLTEEEKNEKDMPFIFRAIEF